MMTKYIEIDRAIETALLLLEEGEDEQTLAYNAALVAFIKNMENVPAADVEPRWIPVTERLPDAYGRYLVTLEDEDYISVMPLYYGRINRIDTFYDSDSEYGDIEYRGIIAWMPLPDAYKGGEKE